LSATHRELPFDPPPTIAECERIVETYASLHAALWDSPKIKGEIRFGLPDLGTYVDHLNEPFAGLVDFLGDRLSTERHRRCERMLADPTLLKSRIAAGKNLTLIHGDAHAANVFHPREGIADSIRIVDWETWRIRPVTWDLAYMMAMFWYPERRQVLETKLLRHYHRALLVHGVRGYEFDDLWRDYRLAVLDPLTVILSQYEFGLPARIWWHNLERILLAHEDLGCDELRGGI